MSPSIDVAAAEASIARLGFLSQALRQAPTSDMLAALTGQKADEHAIEEARIDFQRLLEGPEKPLCPPWESAWMSEDDLLFQSETLAVRAAYHRQGLELKGSSREPEDHIAFELAFCAFLVSRLAEEQDEDALAQLESELRSFCQEHLGLWGAPWARSLADKAQAPYWREVGALLEDEVYALMTLAEEMGES